MLVTHSVCAGACWYGSSPGAGPATGTARGWAAHPTQRETQKDKKAYDVPEHTTTHTHRGVLTQNTCTPLMRLASAINTDVIKHGQICTHANAESQVLNPSVVRLKGHFSFSVNECRC